MARRPGLANALKDFTAQLTRSASGLVTAWTRWGGTGVTSRVRLLLPGSRFDYEREAGDFWNNSVLALTVKWVGDNWPKPKLQQCRMDRQGRPVPLPRAAMLDLLSRPNPYYTGRTLRKAIGLSLICDGNAFVYKRRARSGLPVQLWWVPHWACMPCWPADGSTFITHYQIRIDTTTWNVPVEDIIHYRDGIDPRNDRLGLAAVKAQLREICTINEESGYTASLMRNAGVPGLVVVPKSESARIDRPDAERIKQQLREDFASEGRGDAMVFSGAVDVKPMGFSPEQLKLDRLPARAEARILAASGLSPMVLGLPDPNKTYSNLSEAETDAWRSCLVPLQDLDVETLRWQLLPDFDDPMRHTLVYDYEQIEALQENRKIKSDRVQGEFKAGLITKNEGRESLGYEPHPDGDVFYPGTGNDPEPEPMADPMANPGRPAGDLMDPDANDEETGDKGLNGRAIKRALPWY